MSDERIGETGQPSSPLLNECAVSSKVISIDCLLLAGIQADEGQTTYLPLSLEGEEVIVEMGSAFVGSRGAIQSRCTSLRLYSLAEGLKPGSYDAGT